MSKQIKRSIDADRFPRMLEDTAFLVDRIHRERGELDLRLRANYFNLYYKGNSMAKVSVMPAATQYEVAIHRKFTKAADSAPDLQQLPLRHAYCAPTPWQTERAYPAPPGARLVCQSTYP